MATSVKKLTIDAKQTADQAVSYLLDAQAAGDYYTEDGQAFSRWLATDRVRTFFGLHKPGEGMPDRWTIADLLSGRHPVTGELMRQGSHGTMVGGIDVTVSPAPKSVSILWALGDRHLREEIEEMVVLAVDFAIGRMFDVVPLLRERYGPENGDVRHVTGEDYLGVQVLHTTARVAANSDGVPDPNLHVHNVLMGALDYAGRLRAIDSRAILKHRSQLDAEASGHLAEMFRQRGWEIERKLIRGPSGAIKRVGWEVGGVPAGLIKAMSSRRHEIENLRQEYRTLSGREAEGPGWDKFVAEHRGPKSRLSPAEMREAWAADARAHEFGPEVVADAKERAAARTAEGIPERDTKGPEAEQLKREILADLCREHAVVPISDLAKLAQQRAIGLVKPSEAWGVVGDLVGDGDLIQFVDGHVTTLEVLAAEQRALAAAEKILTSPSTAPASPDRVEAEIRRAEENGRPFDDGQLQAVRLATSGARLVSITGPAGTGKGHASRAIASAWQQQGRRVIALAVAGRTAQQAKADSGAREAWTIDGLKARIDYERVQLGPRDVLLVDEAGMIDHERYVVLLEAAADAGATVIQVGDDRQLTPVGPGGLWTVIHGRAETRGQTVELRTIWRAREPREGQAWTDLRQGRIEEALLYYRDSDRLRLYDGRQELLAGMVADWWAGGAKGLMIVDTSNAERDVLNRLAQATRLEAGELGAEALTLKTGREIRAGDELLFNKIHYLDRDLNAHGPRVENGTPATVVALAAVELDDRGGLYAAERGERATDLIERRSSQYAAERAARPRPNVAVVELHEPVRPGRPAESRRVVVGVDVPIELAYARHVAKGQGATIEAAGDVAPSMQTRRNQLYTMASRSREGSRIHLVRAEIEELDVDVRRVEPTPDTVRAERQAEASQEPAAEAARSVERETSSAERSAEPILKAEPTAEPAKRSAEKEAEPAGIPWSQVQAEIDAAKADREARAEYATIRQVAKQTQPLAMKQAIGERAAERPTGGRESWEAQRVADSPREATRAPTARVDLEHSRVVGSFVREQRAREADAALREPVREPGRPDPQREAGREQTPARQEATRAEAEPVRSLPARHPVESMGRINAERGNTAMALAYYQAAGRLETTADPAVRAAQRWLADPRPAIVVVDQVQEQRVRDAIQAQRQQEGHPHNSEVRPPPEPRIVQAQTAHAERTAQREAWKAETRTEHHHLVEAGAIERAYVVAPKHHDHQAVTRALSVAAHSEWITEEPSAQTAAVVSANSARITTAQAAAARAQQVRQAERGAEMAQHAQRSAQQEAQRGAERSGAQLEHAAGAAQGTQAEQGGAQRGGAER